MNGLNRSSAVLRRTSAAAIESLENRRLFAVTVFQIDPAQSKLSFSGSAFGIDLDTQESGSLTARYDGTIKTDLTSTTIKFTGGSSIVAESHGSFSPNGGPANYAGEAHGPFGINLGKVAIRGLTLDLSSGVITLANSAFASSEHLDITTGTADYDVKAAGSGSQDIGNNGGDNQAQGSGTISINADGLQTLTLPINVQLDTSDLDVKFTGKLVATAVGTTPIVDLNGPAAEGRDFVAPFVVGQDTVVSAADPTTTVTDVDDTNLVSGRISLGNRLDGASETLSVTTTGTGITSSYNSSTGVLTLTGSATLAKYQQVVASLKYHNAAGTPTVGDRSITVILNDGSDNGPAATTTVQITNPNVATLGTGGAKAVSFTDGDGSVVSLSVKGGGSASLALSGATQQTAGKKGIAITGTNVSLNTIVLTDPSLKSKLSISVKGGDGATAISSITSNAPLSQVGGKAVDLTGVLNIAGFLARADFRNVTNATITAGSIGRFTARGDMTGSTLTLTDPFIPILPLLGRFTVTGMMSGSRITTAGNIGRVTVGSMIASQIYAGRTSNAAFPSTLADFSADDVIIARVSLGTKHATTAAFDNSVIAGRTMLKISLGSVKTANAGVPFGVTADKVLSLSASNETGQALKVKNLDDPTASAAALTATGFTFADLQIRII